MGRVKAGCLIAAVLALPGCQQQKDTTADKAASSLPSDWATRNIPGCCLVAIPPNANFSELPDRIDDPTYRIQGEGFEALLTVTSMGTGLPPKSSGSAFTERELIIDGRKAKTATFSALDRSDLSERRHLVWTFKGENDGRGSNLVVTMMCKPAACAVFEPMVASLKRT